MNRSTGKILVRYEQEKVVMTQKHLALLILLCMGRICCADDGLVAHYTFEEGPGEVVKDYSGKGNHGKNLGAKYINLGEAKGYALSFDTADAYVDCGNDLSLNTPDGLTIDLWFYPHTKAAGGHVGVVGRGKRIDDGGFMFTYENDNFVFFTNVYKDRKHRAVRGIVPGTWYHIVASFNGRELKTYVNGKQTWSNAKLDNSTKSKGSKITILNQNIYLRFPAVWGTKRQPKFKCMMDDVRIYNRALSDGEIVNQYKHGAKLRGIDVGVDWFNKVKLIPHVYPLASKLLVEADFLYLKPVPKDATLILELHHAQGNKVVANTTFTDLFKTNKIEWTVDTKDMLPGEYELRALVKAPNGSPVGSPSTIEIKLPQKPSWLKANEDVKVLNNWVAQLLDVREPQEKSYVQYKVVTPRPGWIFLSSTTAVNSPQKVLITIDGAAKDKAVIAHTAGESQTIEAMRYLSQGTHTIEVYCEGRGRLKNLIVRSIPELIRDGIGYDIGYDHHHPPFLTCYGPYNWKYLQEQGLLNNVNVLLESAIRPENESHYSDWKKTGKKIFAHWNINVLQRLADPKTPDSIFNRLIDFRGFNNPTYDGTIMDEFDGHHLPRNQKDYPIYAQGITRLSRSEKYKDKGFYTYCKDMDVNKYSRTFTKALMAGGYRLAEEVYMTERPTEEEAIKHMDVRLRQMMLRYQEVFADCQKSMIMNMGFFTAMQPSLSLEANVDMKVYMDMQMNLMANDPIYSGIYGMAWYHLAHVDEETLRWSDKLIRHYCIEGKRERLTNDPYILSHIKNGDFDEGTTGWTLEGAQEGSITVKHLPEVELQGRYLHTQKGRNYLMTIRNAKGLNRCSQPIKNLQPGRFYSLKMLTADYGALCKGVSEKKVHPVNIKIDDVELIPDKTIEHTYARAGRFGSASFTAKNPAWLTYRRIVFRAKNNESRLILSDWMSDDAPGGPIGQQLIHNYLELQPYLEN